MYIRACGMLFLRFFLAVPARVSSGAVEVVHHPYLHGIAFYDDIHRVDVLVGMSFDELVDIHVDDLFRYVFAFDINLHKNISFTQFIRTVVLFLTSIL